MSDSRLVINHNGTVFEPPVKDEVRIEWERNCVGKLTFTTIKVPNAGMSFQEGDSVTFYYKDKPIFVGYVFTKKRDKNHHIQVTCYDQIRYLKNKFTYSFKNQTASQIVSAICKDMNLKVGKIEDSKYVIPVMAEENVEVLDIILKASEETLMNTGKMFVLYDDCGSINFINCASLVSDSIIDKDTAQDFDYTSTIDEDVYNSVILYYKPENQTQR